MRSPLKEVGRLIRQWQNAGEKVGLITGCFDILHEGHIGLFQFARHYVNYLVVGVDNDGTINASKGAHRPFNPLQSRLKILCEIKGIDAVFPITEIFHYADQNTADRIHEKILTVLKPDVLFTATCVDNFWRIKKRRAEKLGVTFIADPGVRKNSTTAIIEKVQSSSIDGSNSPGIGLP